MDDWRNFPLAITYFVCFKPTPLWFFVYRTSFPPVYQDLTCTANFLYRYTSLISATSWYTGGGTMFYKIISFLVDYIVKKWQFCPKISKIRQYTEEILVWNQYLLIIQIRNIQFFPMFVCWNFCPYWADFPPYHNRSFIKYTNIMASAAAYFKRYSANMARNWLFFKNWMFNFVSLLKYKRQMTGNKLRKPVQRSGAGLRIICYPSSDVYTSINWQN